MVTFFVESKYNLKQRHELFLNSVKRKYPELSLDYLIEENTDLSITIMVTAFNNVILDNIIKKMYSLN